VTINDIFEALDKAGVLSYCPECSGQDKSHQLDENGECYRHGEYSKEVCREKVITIFSEALK
jgi:hypothetical protein